MPYRCMVAEQTKADQGRSASVHTYATEALGNGLSGPVVASLLGHRSTKMIDEHYSHLDQRGDLLKEAAKRATGRE